MGKKPRVTNEEGDMYCAHCDTWKKPECFTTRKGGIRDTQCKECVNASRHNETFKEYNREYQRQYRRDNPERIRELNRENWNRHRDKYLETRRNKYTTPS